VLVALVVMLVVERRRDLRRALGAGALLIGCLAASFTGSLLPWDQLALWAVTVGTNMTGYEPLRAGDVRFVLMDGRELSPSWLLSWLAVHVSIGTAAMLGAIGLVAAWRRRRNQTPPSSPNGQ
jgi:quinol-cytochrome oxidoreductase complex cytochrome b subunit